MFERKFFANCYWFCLFFRNPYNPESWNLNPLANSWTSSTGILYSLRNPTTTNVGFCVMPLQQASFWYSSSTLKYSPSNFLQLLTATKSHLSRVEPIRQPFVTSDVSGLHICWRCVPPLSDDTPRVMGKKSILDLLRKLHLNVKAVYWPQKPQGTVYWAAISGIQLARWSKECFSVSAFGYSFMLCISQSSMQVTFLVFSN